MISQIVALKYGVTVVLADHRGDGWYRAIVIHSTNPSYAVGGHDLSVGPNDIAEGLAITLPDDVMTELIAKAPVRGPEPTIEDFFRSLTGHKADV